MHQINTITKKFTEAVTIDLGQLPTVDTRIDFILTDGSNPVIAENKTFAMTIGTVLGSLYKTDNDTVSFRYLKFNDDNIADTLVITMTMDGVEILNDTVSLTYQTSGGGSSVTVDSEMSESSPNPVANSTLTQAINNKEDKDYLCFTATQANSTVRLNKYGTPPTINLEYSVDKKTWTEYTWDGNTGATITLANIGDSVWWRGDNTAFSSGSSNNYFFGMSGSIEASGNVMSLLDKTCKSVTIPTKYCFYRLFDACSSLKKAPELPATTLQPSCYQGMFYSCSSLTKAPELPATKIANRCYSEMFNSCFSLKKAPELPATALYEYCYYQMFYSCSSLTKAPELPDTRMVNGCYDSMFKNCTSLKKLKVNFTEWSSSLADWLSGASATSVFECPSALDCSIRDASHVPAKWTIVRTDSPKSITSPTTASSEATYQVSPSTPSVPVVTVASALTLNARTVDNGSVTYAEIVLDVASGATVTAGTNLTLVDTPTAGKRNICVVRWSGGTAKLYVTIVENLPQA